MRFPEAPRRRPRETVVPMINVVFLLLIFFLMTAQIAPAPPLDLTLPEGTREQAAEAETALYIAADGTVALAGAEGDPWAALAADPPAALTLRADAALEAAEAARILARLAALGIDEVQLAVRPR
jgi:biopolymer transport protein ExbD